MSKQTVSELKRMFETRDESSGTQLIKTQFQAIYDRPKFMREKSELSPAERGTAMHIVMQNMPLEDQPTLLDVEFTLEELLRKEILTPEQVEAISSEQIVQFFDSEIGQRML